uniref:Uncharacterized protein n=1 Tax=Phlegmariurus squarrosus TaxID=73615 RepID=H9M861_PHLSQ|nr:hypothetical protein HusqMp79 [Phlegmariurus squarrosus]AEV55768.1 hypothetical protein HusqMp79 [Phlegmariurus squarrosus]
MSAYYECGFDLFDMMPEVVLRQNFIPFPFHLLHLIWKPSFSFLGLYFLGQSAEWSQWKMEWHVFLNLTKFKLENWLSASSRNTASSAGLFLRLREMVLNMNRIYCYLWPIFLGLLLSKHYHRLPTATPSSPTQGCVLILYSQQPRPRVVSALYV